jgi:small basic protein
MNKIKYWFCWIAVFPGAIIAGLLATFPLHWILYFTLANGETISGVNIQPIEYLLYPFVVAITYILAGYQIAPESKFKTAVVLFGVYFFIWLAINVTSLFNGNVLGIDMQFSWRTILSLIGAAIGLYIAKILNKKTDCAKP